MRNVLLLFVLPLCGLLFCPAPGRADAPVRIGLYPFDPLCRVEEDDAHTGLFVQLARRIAAQEGWEVEFIPGTLQASFDGVRKGELDLLLAAPLSRQVDYDVCYARETVISTWAQVYTGDKLILQSMLDLAGRTVGVVRDDPYNEELRTIVRRLNIECRFVEFADPGDVLNALQENWIEAGIVDRLYGVLHEQDYQVKRTAVIFSPIEFRFAAPPGRYDRHLAVVDFSLATMKRNPNSFFYQQLNAILSTTERSSLMLYLWWGLGAALVLLVLLGGASLLLRQQVRKKTAELRKNNAALQEEISMRREAENRLLDQKRYLDALHEISLGLISKLDLQELLDSALSRAAVLVGAEHGFIFLKEDNRLLLHLGVGAFAELQGKCIEIGEGLSGRVVQTGNPMIVANYADWSGRLHDASFARFRSTMAIPLKTGDQVIGVIGLAHQGDQKFGYTELDILKRFGELASLALENARLYARLAEELHQREITERERRRLAQAIDQAMESILVVDHQGLIEYINPAFERETGYRRDEFLGQPVTALTEHRLHPRESLEQLHELEHQGAWTGRFTSRHKDGTPYSVEATISPVLDEEGRLSSFVSFRRDVTHESRLEAQLRQSQKMESMGTLAGGIAHDFNNILIPIMGHSELVMQAIPLDDVNYHRMEQIKQAAERARELVKQILAFGRKAEEEKRTLLLQPIVKEALKLLRASLPATIEIQLELDSDCGPVMADAVQIHQILMNLCTNAYHAMRDKGGTLTVSLHETRIGSDSSLPLEPGTYLALSVSDTGEGIPPEIQDRIFDPYFTTKDPGEGTGLGLAVVHGIVRSYGGHITLRSERGTGTEFRVYLPRVQQEQPAMQRHPATGALVSSTGNERIMLVDDEESIVHVMREMLGQFGYDVIAHTDSAAALQQFTCDPHSVDLVITDQTMPALTGEELTRQLLSLRPDLPIIMWTGFSEVVSEERAREIGIRRFLNKPVGCELVQAVQEVLACEAETSWTE